MRFVWLLVLGALPLAAVEDYWVVAGPGGRQEARAVASGERCPTLRVNGNAAAMARREGRPDGFPAICEAVLPANARQAELDGARLPLLEQTRNRYAVVGDTGCRVKAGEIQDCDEAHWPFLKLARMAVNQRPSLVIHVGDYLYRETACPAGRNCAGAFGDNWAAWKIDFFEPGRELLHEAPWVFGRGNHEDCSRAWRGYFYLLAPGPMPQACVTTMEPYLTPLARERQLAVMDSAAALDDRSPRALEQVNLYRLQLGWIAQQGRGEVWLTTHKPFFGLRPNLHGGGYSEATLVEAMAWEAQPAPQVTAILSGHVHLFEMLEFGGQLPVQIVAGDGGTYLAQALPARIADAKVLPAPVKGVSFHEFGYLMINGNHEKGLQWRLMGEGGEIRSGIAAKAAR